MYGMTDDYIGVHLAIIELKRRLVLKEAEIVRLKILLGLPTDEDANPTEDLDHER